MKYSRIVAALLAVTLMACSKKEKEPTPSYPDIPADVTFDKATLTGLSDQEFASAKMILKTFTSLVDFEDQLAHKYESDKDRTEREEDFNKMTPAQQALVNRKRTDCTVEEDKKEADHGDDLKAGSNVTGYDKARIYGPLCGSESVKDSNVLSSVLAADKTTFTLDMGVKASIALSSNVTNVADQAVLGYSSMSANFQADARAKGTFFAMDVYMTSSGTMTANTIQAGEILLNLNMEVLARADRSSSSKIIALFSVQGKQHQLTVLSTKDAGGTGEHEEIYIGNRLLTEQDKAEIGKLKFTDQMAPKD